LKDFCRLFVSQPTKDAQFYDARATRIQRSELRQGVIECDHLGAAVGLGRGYLVRI